MVDALVSCIMPTRDRRVLAGQAVRYFLRQDYPLRELIVVDDGDDPIGDVIPDDARIRYIRLDETASLGRKRNIACEHARGELIAHWDDDDWMSSRRLSLQVAALGRLDACGGRDVLHYRLEEGDAWLYRHAPNGRPWVAGGTLLYRRSVWARRPFDDVGTGEDAAFVGRLAPARVRALEDASFYLALVHERNSARKDVDDPHWERRTVGEVAARLGRDADFYAGLRNRGTPPVQPAPPSTLAVAAPFLVYDGYGSMAEYLVRSMARAGARVHPLPLEIDRDGLSREFLELLDAAEPAYTGPVLYSCWPRADLARFEGSRELFIYTMWEGSELPRGWPRQLDGARAVVTPTRFAADVCRRSGVRVPVEVVPEGVDPCVYRLEQRPEREGVTTLVVGTAIERKNLDCAVAAWRRAFAGDRSARLIVKSRFGSRPELPDDARIEVVVSNERTRGIAHWYRRADVLLALGNEGFGLPLVEAMATGLPVVALDSEGQSDVCRDAGDLVLAVEPAELRRYVHPVFGPGGSRGIPPVEEVADRLRWVAGHRDEARALGREAAAWVARHRDVWARGPAVLDAIEPHLQPPRTLRRVPTMWVPTYGSPCGLADDAERLAEALPQLSVRAGRPDLTATSVLHVQHEPGVFRDGDLLECLEEARDRGVPVAVTEHMVLPGRAAWEEPADALIATTEAGARRLRERWPGKRVEQIPIGCSTWFPPRKRERGRVIGAFGFLAPYKGFGRLLGVLRSVPGTELVMYSHARQADAERAFDAASRGLPVRRVGDYLALAEVARRLAAEADVLVFPYDEPPHPAASGAVRVGLATGVPVLTSRAGWFADVRDATLQTDDLASGVGRLLEDTPLRERLTAAARELCEHTSWQRIARRHVALWNELEATT